MQRWIKYFIDKGHEVHVITHEPAEIEGAHTHDIFSPTSPFFYKIPIIARFFYFWHERYQTKKMRKLLEEIEPDILDAHYLTSYGIPASRLRFHPFIITIWGSDVLLAPNEFGKKHVALMKKALREADIILCFGEHTRDEVIKLGKEPDRVKTALLGVDTQIFYPQPKDRKLRLSLGILDSPTVVSIRNFEPVYDIETLIQAIPSVLSQSPEAKFVIAGEGSQRDCLEELAKSLGIWERIRFVGRIAHDELPKYLTSADIYVSTSLSDSGASISLLEAIACGLPAIVTDVGDVRKWIENGKNGFVIPVKSAELLAEKIVYLLRNGDLRKKARKANRVLVEEKASFEKEMGKVERLYQELKEEFRENSRLRERRNE